MFGFLKRRRRKRLRSLPFPAEWLAILEKNVPLYNRLPSEDRHELHGHMHVFLAEKRFEGCGGLEITDEIRVTIAAQACLLLLHRNTDYYRRLSSILVYPRAYVAPLVEPCCGLVGEEVRLGEAWQLGAVVLSWDAVQHGAEDVEDGSNLVFHEFAHQLDMEDGAPDGAPILEHTSHYISWARVLGAEYEQLRRCSQRGGRTAIDQYGAEDPAEFFAVATECFFERPVLLQRKHPELYDELKRYYLQDPAQRHSPESPPPGC